MNKSRPYKKNKKETREPNRDQPKNRKQVEYLKDNALRSHTELTDRWKYVSTIEEYAKYKINDVSFSQIRNLFNLIQKENSTLKLPDIDYKLKYLAGRSGTDQRLKFLLRDLIIPLLKQVDDEEKLSRYQEFLTALLCYHKFYAKKK